MTEQNDLSVQDELDLKSLDIEAELEAPTRTLLEIWSFIFDGAEASRDDRIAPLEALKLITAWPKLALDQVPQYFEYYYSYLGRYRKALAALIKEDPSTLKNTKKDAEDNREVYLELIHQWQRIPIEIENGWDITHTEAYIQIAAMSMAGNFIFSPHEGIINHFAQIDFQLTPEDNDKLEERRIAFIEELKGSESA